MSASQNNLTLLVNQQDANGANIVNRSIGAIAYAGVAGEFHDGIQKDIGSHLNVLEVCKFFWCMTSSVLTGYEDHAHIGNLGENGGIVKGTAHHS